MTTASSAPNVLRRSVGLALLACALVAPAAAQDFQAAHQACLDGKSGQVFEACMKEARAVKALPPGSMPVVSPEQLRRNSMLRCEALTGEDRADCVARVGGAGTTSGSVGGGGVLHELTTVDGAPADPAPK